MPSSDDEDYDSDDSADRHRGRYPGRNGGFPRPRRDDSSPDARDQGPALSAEEKNEKMKSMFQSGLAIHFAGEEMKACK